MKNLAYICKAIPMNPTEIDTVIYHDPCQDGCTAAAIIYLFNQNRPEAERKNIDFLPFRIKAPAPTDLRNRNILIADYSFDLESLTKLAENNRVLVIDHHKTSQAALQDFPASCKIFDMNHSGSMLVWKYVYPDQEAPLFVKYSEARDMWKKDPLPDVDAWTAYIETVLVKDPAIFAQHIHADVQPMINKGLAFKELNDHYIESALKYSHSPTLAKFNEQYYYISYVNSSVLKSDIGNKLLAHFPNCSFSVVYSSSDSGTSFSLRSDPTRTDVSMVATKLGGGGHRDASGAYSQIPTTVLPGMSHLDHGRTYDLLKNAYIRRFCLIDGRDFLVVFINTSVFGHELASFLLQSRYTDKAGKRVQEVHHVTGDSNDEVVSVAVAWYQVRETKELIVRFDETMLATDPTTDLPYYKQFAEIDFADYI